MKAKLAVIVAAALLLVGCASTISSGTITKKNYNEPYSYLVSYCAMYNTKMNCTMWSQRMEYVPASWSFDLRNDNKQTGWVDVSQSEFDKYNVGDYYGEKR